jgi:hypothetical protein
LSRDAGGRDTGRAESVLRAIIAADIRRLMPGISPDDNTGLALAQPSQRALEYRLLFAKLSRSRKPTPITRRDFPRSAFNPMRFAITGKSGTLTAMRRIHISVHEELMRSDDTF